MNLFGKCSHKAKYLAVFKDSSEEPAKGYEEDFTTVTHHLYCLNCREKVNIKYAKMIGSVDDFLRRGGVRTELYKK